MVTNNNGKGILTIEKSKFEISVNEKLIIIFINKESRKYFFLFWQEMNKDLNIVSYKGLSAVKMRCQEKFADCSQNPHLKIVKAYKWCLILILD